MFDFYNMNRLMSSSFSADPYKLKLFRSRSPMVHCKILLAFMMELRNVFYFSLSSSLESGVKKKYFEQTRPLKVYSDLIEMA